METAISVKNVQVSYHGKQAVTRVDFEIDQHNVIGIIGPNGAGKSTLLKAMLNLVPLDSGTIEVLGKPLHDVRQQIAYVAQRNQYDWDFPINVLDTVLMGTYPNMGLLRRPRKKDREWAYECLKKVGMEEFSKRQIGELSGGQQQRVFLARALTQKADIFFLDEPFVGIDIASEETIMRLLKGLKQQGKTVFVVHHDLSKAHDYFDQLILLNKTVIQYGTPSEVLLPDVMLQAYDSELGFLKKMGAYV